MMRSHIDARALVLTAGLVCGLAWSAADRASADAAKPEAAPAEAPKAAGGPAVAAVGLLPIHGVGIDLDALPTTARKGDHGKDDSMAALQQLWDSYLKGAGFNVIQFGVDVHDLSDRGAGRVARLCEWSKQNNVRIAPSLTGGPEGKPLPADYATSAAAFVGRVIEKLGGANGPGVQSYSQIMLYQLGRPLNHPASHGPLEPSAAAALLQSAAEKIRAAEQAGLSGSQLQASPLLVSCSFDYELIRRGAIAHTPITDDTYAQAYGGLKDYLLAVVGAAPVEAVSVEWFPGSLSSDGVDRLPDLVTKLEADLPGKLLVMDTGYSSAAGTDTAQARYYALALNNLCDLRANQGVDSPFAGILWRSAIDAGAGDGGPAVTPAQAEHMDWKGRAQEVTRMWNDPSAASADARSWVASIQSHFGLLARAGSAGSSLAPKTAYRVMSGLDSTLASSAVATGAMAAVKELVSPGKGSAVGQQLKSRLQTAMFGMLDAWLAKTADNLFTSSDQGSEAPSSPGLSADPPDIQIVGLGEVPASGLKVGMATPIAVTLFNAGAGPASDATIYLRDKNAVDLGRTNPTTLSPGGTTTVTLQFVPVTAGTIPGVSVEAFCSHDTDPSSNHAELGDLQVEPKTKVGGLKNGLLTSVAGTKLVMATDGGSSPPTTSTTQPGFAGIEGLRAVNMTFVSSSAPAGSSPSSGSSTPTTMSRTAPPPPTGAPSTGATARSAPAAGSAPTGSAPVPMMSTRTLTSPQNPIDMTVVNPFNTTFRDCRATFSVDDRVVAVRPLGMLLPLQRRTVSFSEWLPPHPGTYRVHVALDGLGPTGNRLTSSMSSTIDVRAGSAAEHSAPTPYVAHGGRAGTRSIMPLLRTASSAPVRSIGRGPAEAPSTAVSGVRSLASSGPALGLTPNSILLRPFPPSAGSPLSVSVQLSNVERLPARQVRVKASIDGDNLGEMSVDVPASGTAIASGFRDWPTTPGRHDVRASVIQGTHTSEATKPVFVIAGGNKTFVRSFASPQATPQPGARTFEPAGKGAAPTFKSTLQPGTSFFGTAAGTADLAITTNDIHFTPASPTAGAGLAVSITVRNAGSGIARDGRVLAVLTADGKEVARQTFAAAVPAHGALPLTWSLTAPAGSIAVTATATASGDPQPGNNQARAAAGAAFQRTPSTIKLTR